MFRTSAFLLLFAASVPAALTAQAQPTPPTPAEQAQHQVHHYTDELSLTSDQQQQALTIFTEEATAAQPLETSNRALRTTLNSAILAANTATITSTAASMSQVFDQLTTLRAAAQAKFYLLLNATQKTQYATMLSEGPMGRRHHGPGGPDGPDGPPPA